MALKALSRTRVRLLGWSDPRAYEAGKTDDGHSFPAGRSMQVCVGSDAHDFTVMKVNQASIDAVAGTLANAGPGIEVEIEFEQTRRALVLHKLTAAAK